MLVSKSQRFVLCALAASLLAAAPPAAAAEFVLRIGTITPTGTPWAKTLQRMKKRIQADTNGRVSVKIYWHSKLGNENMTMRRCVKGQIGGVGVSLGAVANQVPELFAVELPYLFDNDRQVDEALERARPKLDELMEAKGVIPYMWGENGWRHFATSDRFILEPSHLKGMKMRAQPSKPHVWMYEALGASHQQLGSPDVLRGLSSGLVTGYDNTLIFGYVAQWYSRIKYVTLSAHIFQPAVLAFCKPFFDKLPPDLQAAVRRIPAGEEQRARAKVRHLNKMLEEKYVRAGIQIKRLTAAQRAAFKAATASVRERFRKTTSAQGRELLKLLEGR